MKIMKLVGAFNQEKALVGAFSVIVKTGCGTDDGSICGTSLHECSLRRHVTATKLGCIIAGVAGISRTEAQYHCTKNVPGAQMSKLN